MPFFPDNVFSTKTAEINDVSFLLCAGIVFIYFVRLFSLWQISCYDYFWSPFIFWFVIFGVGSVML